MSKSQSRSGGIKGKYESVKIRKTSSSCSLCEDFSKREADKSIAILSCEGACLRGELSRRAANLVCFKSMPKKTVRICLGGAFTKDTGQRNLVKNAKKVVVLEGCVIQCASRMMEGVIPGLKPKIIITDRLSGFKKSLFGINEMPEREIKKHAEVIAMKIVACLR